MQPPAVEMIQCNQPSYTCSFRGDIANIGVLSLTLTLTLTLPTPTPTLTLTLTLTPNANCNLTQNKFDHSAPKSQH